MKVIIFPGIVQWDKFFTREWILEQNSWKYNGRKLRLSEHLQVELVDSIVELEMQRAKVLTGIRGETKKK